MARAQENIAEVALTGRAGVHAGRSGAVADRPFAPAANPDDIALRDIMDRYDQLGSEPPEFVVAANDAAHRGDGAHTIERHGPDIPLSRDPNTRTIEGRIYGDPPWSRPENWSYRWTDPSTMNRTVNDYLKQNWETIRTYLAMDEEYNGSFDARHRVGQGYYNEGMYGAGPINSHYAETSFVKIRIRLTSGADLTKPFLVTAFPSGLL